jgi:hypothetical protein
MGRVLNVQDNLVSLPGKTFGTLGAVFAFVLSQLDLLVQRVAAIVGLTRFGSTKYTNDGVRVFNRVIIATWALLLCGFMSMMHYESIVQEAEVPILGSIEQDISLIYPPIGTKFYPQVAYYNIPPRYRPRTPLLIPFTRNNTLMKQTILSYVSSGWPRADIIIVDNSGTMDANPRRLLSRGNPFYLDYDIYRRRYGISIIQTPTLLNFAQLQNFMLRLAISRDWPYFFWSHMDVAVLGAEEVQPYKSFYHRVLDVLDASGMDQWEIKARRAQLDGVPSHDRKEIFSGWFDRVQRKEPELQTKKKRSLSKRELREKPRWGIKLFAYDYLTLVNVDAWRDVGPWDPFIPYYATDCDAYERLKMAGYQVEEVQVGHVFDIADAIKDPEQRFFPPPNQQDRNRWGIGPSGEEPLGGRLNSWRYKWLKSELSEMVDRKTNNPDGRNYWQSGGDDERKPGKDGRPKRKNMEAWTYDPKGFQAAWWNAADAGRSTYIKKWGTMDCDLRGAGKTLDDIWLLEYAEEGSEAYKLRDEQQQHWLAKLEEHPIR